MSCMQEWMLSAHLEGDLEPVEARRVEAHLAGCERCQVVQREFGKVRAELAALANVEPARDLWPEISIRHNAEQQRPWLRGMRWGWPVLAAATMAALLLLISPRDAPEAPDAKVARAYASVVAAERLYVDSVATLEEALGDRAMAGLSPGVRATIERGLEQIDETIRRCREELAGAPNDLGTHRVLLAAYQRKVDLLTELVDRSN